MFAVILYFLIISALCCFLFKSIGKLRQLRYLDLAKNRIESLDADISGCESLEDLLLSSNMLQHLPDSIGELCLFALPGVIFNSFLWITEVWFVYIISTLFYREVEKVDDIKS